MSEETNEFQKQMKEFIDKLQEAIKQAEIEARREAQVTQVIDGQYGKYLIHLN
jgi:RNA-binding protein YlmH